MKLKPFHRAGLLTALLFIFTAIQSRADLPPDAQEAMKKGIIAAKEQEWEIAIQSFQDARKIAPDAPEIYYNLGLAESKMPGRELRAICWLGAYLAATTNAPNADAVKDAITGLQIKSEGNIKRLIKTVQDAADQLPDAPISIIHGLTGDFTTNPDKDRMDKLDDVMRLWASSGNSDKAMQAANRLVEAGPRNKDYVLGEIGESQVEAGFIGDAIKTADMIHDSYYICTTRGAIAAAQAKDGDISDAQATLTLAKQSVKLQEADVKKVLEPMVAGAEKNITNSLPPQTMISVSDWIGELNGYNLNTVVYLDIVDAVKTPQQTFKIYNPGGGWVFDHGSEAMKDFLGLEAIARNVVDEKNKIDQMLKQQAKQQAQP